MTSPLVAKRKARQLQLFRDKAACGKANHHAALTSRLERIATDPEFELRCHIAKAAMKWTKRRLAKGWLSLPELRAQEAMAAHNEARKASRLKNKHET